MASTPDLLGIPPEARSMVLSYCFTGFETYYDHEGKRQINSQEADECTFAISMVNRQLRDEAMPIVKAKTAIVDCTNVPDWFDIECNGVPAPAPFALAAPAFKMIEVLLVKKEYIVVPDYRLFPNLRHVGVSTRRPISNSDINITPRSDEEIIKHAKSSLLSYKYDWNTWIERLLGNTENQVKVWAGTTISACHWWLISCPEVRREV